MHAPHLLILNFHGLGSPSPRVDPDETRFWISPKFFGQVLDLVDGASHVRITFDDGNASDFDVALRELARHHQRAEFFLLAGRLNQPGYLTTRQVREMVAEGMTFGSHGFAHRRWPDCDDATLSAEIGDARARIEDATGHAVTSASCPFGAYDRRSLDALRMAGFERVYTSDRGLARSDNWLQSRNTLRVTDTLSDVEQQLRWSPYTARGYADRLRVWWKSRG
jgi:peptidoglycan/xylan/chitin deacetylase (PgdA/CDA1 family)